MRPARCAPSDFPISVPCRLSESVRALEGVALRLIGSCIMTFAILLAGKPLYLVLVSWLYALYSFDYRWGLSRKHLQQRIAFFQQHWAFFLGACIQ